jgi:broad-specificity NMP kinase
LVKEQQLFTQVDDERDTLIADTEKVSEYLEKLLVNTTGTTVIEGHYAVNVVPKLFLFLDAIPVNSRLC